MGQEALLKPREELRAEIQKVLLIQFGLDLNLQAPNVSEMVERIVDEMVQLQEHTKRVLENSFIDTKFSDNDFVHHPAWEKLGKLTK